MPRVTRHLRPEPLISMAFLHRVWRSHAIILAATLCATGASAQEPRPVETSLAAEQYVLLSAGNSHVADLCGFPLVGQAVRQLLRRSIDECPNDEATRDRLRAALERGDARGRRDRVGRACPKARYADLAERGRSDAELALEIGRSPLDCPDIGVR